MSEERELLKQALSLIESGRLGKMDWGEANMFSERVSEELAKPNPEPIAWLYDFTIEGETITDRTTTDIDVINNLDNGYHNIRPLYLKVP